jgi:SAM-dependent methyltransferase
LEFIVDLFNLGNLFLSDFLANGEEPRCEPVDLQLEWDSELNCARLKQTADPSFMYGRYWYRSGTNQTMKDELAGIVASALQVKGQKNISTWLDIACNDGTLLEKIPQNIYKIGIDPADESFTEEAKKHGDLVIRDYFSAESYPSNAPKADIITCIAMFYDLDNPRPFLNDAYSVLDDDGIFILQMSYTPLMLAQVAFDNICHEHVYYYSLDSIKTLFESCGFKIMDCQLNDVNGGSFRIYAMKDVADKTKFGAQPYRDVCKFRVDSILAHERETKVNTPEVWNDFFVKIENLKAQTLDFLKKAKEEGKTVWGYGASTKGNTLLQYFGIDETVVDAIAERSPYKFGLRTIGTNIPIKSEDEMRDAKPDYLLVLPWHFRAEFILREKSYLDGGGKFVFPCPVFDIVGS